MTIELWHIVLLSLSVLSGFWALTKIIAAQFERNLSINHRQIADRLDRIELVNREESAEWQRVERDLLRFQAELPLHYVRREDYIRGQSVIEAKLDGLADKVDNSRLRTIINGGKNAN